MNLLFNIFNIYAVVSKVTAVLSNVSPVFQLIFLVVYSGTISKGFSFVAFFASVESGDQRLVLAPKVIIDADR